MSLRSAASTGEQLVGTTSSLPSRLSPNQPTGRPTVRKPAKSLAGVSFKAAAKAHSSFVHDVDMPDFSLVRDEGDEDDNLDGDNSATPGPAKGGVSFFKAEVCKIVDEEGQGQGSCGQYVQPAIMLITFVMTSCGDPVMKAASKVHGGVVDKDFRYEPSSVIFMGSMTSVIIGNCISICQHGLHRGLRRCWHLPTLARCFVPAALFNMAQILKFMALLYLPVDMAVLLDQSSLVLLAIMSRILLGRHYSPPQWCSLVITSTAMLQYVMLREAHMNKTDVHTVTDLGENIYMGILVMMVQVVLAVCGASLTEKLLKAASGAAREDEPPLFFWEQKAQLEFCGGVATLLWIVFAPSMGLGSRQVLDRGLFSGWDFMTVIVMCMLLAKLWLAGIIAKVLDSVVKQLGSCCAMMCTYFIQLNVPPPLGKRGKMEFYTDVAVALFIVALSVSSFALSTRMAQQLTTKESQLQNIVQLANMRASAS